MARRYFRVWGALALCLGLVWAAPAQQEDRANDKPLQKSDKEGKRPQAMPIPYAILVDDKGRVLCDGSAGSVIRNWEKNIKAKPAKKS